MTVQEFYMRCVAKGLKNKELEVIVNGKKRPYTVDMEKKKEQKDTQQHVQLIVH